MDEEKDSSLAFAAVLVNPRPS